MDTENNLALAQEIARAVKQAGGTAYYVGGFVRDRLMGASNKDVDIEIHGIFPGELEQILDGFGKRIAMGESFGIYAIKGYSLDIAMPRKEKLKGTGHKDFDVFVDPFAGVRAAACRRDFTVNAMMQDVLTGEVTDCFGGREDLKNGIIRHVNDETFSEDALRVLRAAQFAARFEFAVAPETLALCSTMTLSNLPKERITGEMEKALLKAERPSAFFETLRSMNQLDVWFPELKALIGVEQNPEYHAEGDVWTHTMMVLDCAVKYRERVNNPLAFMLSALVHDLGKAVCTEFVDGKWRSYMHETKGLPIVKRFISRLTNEKELCRYALNLTQHHMRPNALAAAGSSIKATNKLYDSAVDPEALIYLALADDYGRIAKNGAANNERFLKERLEIFNEYMARDYVNGRDLIEAGLKPDSDFSKYLDYAHKLRLAGVSKENALTQTLTFARKQKKNSRP